MPDIYQGSELWDLRLVDPDNRGDVDFELRRRLLGEIEGLNPEQVLARMAEGRPSCGSSSGRWNCDGRWSNAFDGDSYEPLFAAGAKAEHVVAFMRGGCVIAIVPRLVRGVGGDWGDTSLEIPAGQWRDVLSGDRKDGGRWKLSELTKRFPVALLAANSAESTSG